MYVWERAGWPRFTWDDAEVLRPLAAARLAQGRLLGRMETLGFALRQQAQVETLTENVVKSSEIEGESLDRASVRSSVARRLGVPDAAVTRVDRATDGVVKMMLDATENHAAPLTEKRLFAWHAALFPAGTSRFESIRSGAWRTHADDPMQVISGPVGRERVHFEAPPAKRVPVEMARFLRWFAGREEQEGLLRAGIAHLWFVTIHPFQDGNGRIARAIADQALAQAENSRQRFYSMSSQIRSERSAYYDLLEQTQRGPLDVTPWLVWFLECLARAVGGADSVSAGVLRKADFWRRHADDPLSERQKKVLNRLLDGFAGKLTAKKWAGLGKCSVPTAQRDLNGLVALGILRRNPEGSKNTSYGLVVDE